MRRIKQNSSSSPSLVCTFTLLLTLDLLWFYFLLEGEFQLLCCQYLLFLILDFLLSFPVEWQVENGRGGKEERTSRRKRRRERDEGRKEGGRERERERESDRDKGKREREREREKARAKEKERGRDAMNKRTTLSYLKGVLLEGP